MSQSTNSGLFVTFEGGEGCGKTTQINRLTSALSAAGRRVVATREPGGTPEGEQLRHLIVQRGSGEWSPLAEVLMILAARQMHVENIIRPSLVEGSVVICDRFSDSTIAYQSCGRGLERHTIEALSDIVIGDFKPDLTIVLDMDVQKGLERSSKRLASEAFGSRKTEDRFEKFDMAFHERVRKGFLDIARADKARCHVLDASQDVDVVAGQVRELVFNRLKK
jgi:dTMP kinase